MIPPKKNVQILIVDDNQSHYEEFQKFLENHGKEVIPKTEDFRALSNALARMGDGQGSCEEVLTFLNYESPDFVLLDVSFKADGLGDAGRLLEPEILKKWPSTKLFYITSTDPNISPDRWIDKQDFAYEMMFESMVEKGILLPSDSQIPNKSQQIEEETTVSNGKDTPDNRDNDSFTKGEKAVHVHESEKTGGNKLALGKRLRRWDAKAFRPFVVPIVGFLINAAFYLAILIGLVFAICHVACAAWIYKFGPLQFAEHVFLAFLPLLIISGFFVFYDKVIVPYLQTRTLSPESFNESSKLLDLTKKLFFSSLFSYLCIKFVELILYIPKEKEDGDVAEIVIPYWFDEYFKQANPMIVVYLALGFIVFIAIFYLQLAKHGRQTK